MSAISDRQTPFSASPPPARPPTPEDPTLLDKEGNPNYYWERRTPTEEVVADVFKAQVPRYHLIRKPAKQRSESRGTTASSPPKLSSIPASPVSVRKVEPIKSKSTPPPLYSPRHSGQQRPFLPPGQAMPQPAAMFPSVPVAPYGWDPALQQMAPGYGAPFQQPAAGAWVQPPMPMAHPEVVWGQPPMPMAHPAPAWGQPPMPMAHPAPAWGQSPMPMAHPAPAWGQPPMPMAHPAAAWGQPHHMPIAPPQVGMYGAQTKILLTKQKAVPYLPSTLTFCAGDHEVGLLERTRKPICNAKGSSCLFVMDVTKHTQGPWVASPLPNNPENKINLPIARRVLHILKRATPESLRVLHFAARAKLGIGRHYAGQKHCVDASGLLDYQGICLNAYIASAICYLTESKDNKKGYETKLKRSAVRIVNQYVPKGRPKQADGRK